MVRNNSIVKDAWFCAIEGIAIADKIINFYYEEYDCIPRNKAIGDYKFSIVIYKTFCDYDGKIKKRILFKHFRKDCCSAITPKWKKLLEKCIATHPNEYECFCKKKSKSDYEDSLVLHYIISDNSFDKLGSILKNVQKTLPSAFTFRQLKDILKKNDTILDSHNILSDSFYEKNVLRLCLKYNLNVQQDRELIFSSMSYKLL